MPFTSRYIDSTMGGAEPVPRHMVRQDSGYESLPPGTAGSGKYDTARHRTYTSSSEPQNLMQLAARRHSSRSTGVVRPRPISRPTAQSLPIPRSSHYPPSHYLPAEYPPSYSVPSTSGRRHVFPHDAEDGHSGDEGDAYTTAPPPPPQTVHYWTSDQTRRLEYAAIDAASRGLKGWMKRNLIPACIMPKERHIDFDDDTGSVRRYRLSLDDEGGDPCGSGTGKRKRLGWLS